MPPVNDAAGGAPLWQPWPGEAPAPGSLSVWLCRDAEPEAAAAIAGCQDCLGEEELARMARFRFPALRRQFALAHGLVRQVLSLFHPQVAPRDWRFEAGAQGKPEIAAGLPRIAFNLSHANGLVALAVAAGNDAGPVGVDVEQATRNIGPGIARRYFAPEEVADLEALPEAQQRDRFFTLWSLKESYIKATGFGLSLPLDSFSFAFPAPDRIAFRHHPGRVPPHFAGDGFSPPFSAPAFRQAMLTSPAGERHSLALCGGEPARPGREIPVFESVPGRAVRRLAPCWDRCSAVM